MLKDMKKIQDLQFELDTIRKRIRELSALNKRKSFELHDRIRQLKIQ